MNSRILMKKPSFYTTLRILFCNNYHIEKLSFEVFILPSVFIIVKTYCENLKQVIWIH
jgi:hypothetical protein